MANSKWLLLTDYASKYRISVSTLRRRIKSGSQPHRFEAGRYYLPDDPIQVQSVTHVVDPAPSNSQATSALPAEDRFDDHRATSSVAPGAIAEEPLLTTTSRLLNELKQAYTLILQEREEQILHLKEEISDLKTLVRVLESANSRLSHHSDPYDPTAGPYNEGPVGSA